MSRPLLAVYRLSLRAYPRPFRRDYEAALVQTVRDRCRHGGEPPGRVVARELVDTARTALKMRGASPMSRFTAAAVALAASIVAALVRGPLAVAAVAAVAVAVFVGMRGSVPIEHNVGRRRATRWLTASAVALAAGIAIPAVDGGELSELWWTVMALMLVSGIACAVVGVGLLVTTGRQPPLEAAPRT